MASSKRKPDPNSQPEEVTHGIVKAPELFDGARPLVVNSEFQAKPVTEFQNGQAVRVHRSQIKFAPYNPSSISDEGARKLEENLARRGLMGGIVVNSRTSFIVGGNKRVRKLDKLNGGTDYFLDVHVVDLDQDEEIEQNIFLNNPKAQGFYDLEKLKPLMERPSIEIEATGFSVNKVRQMFGAETVAQNDAAIQKLAEVARENIERFEQIHSSVLAREETEFYLVVTFESNEARAAFAARHGLEDDRYLDARLFESLVGQRRT